MDVLVLCSLESPPEVIRQTPLSKDETTVLKQCESIKRHREVSVSRRLMRYALQKHMQRSVRPLSWHRNGPRYQDGKSSLGLSIAHSKHFAAVALSDFGEIGVDVECADVSVSWRKIMLNVFNESDINWIIGQNGESSDVETKQRFLAIWTAREAYSKFYRRSIFNCLYHPRLNHACNTGVHNNDLNIDVMVDSAWVSAVCRRKSAVRMESRIACYDLSFDDISRQPGFVFSIKDDDAFYNTD
ncbi:MAG: hypothetical protein DHS20C01_24850 [marine bacterium B5-7]|nr:MAG: hypothetical protein DHS20C01_24850 [marine bacterium B5-7]